MAKALAGESASDDLQTSATEGDGRVKSARVVVSDVPELLLGVGPTQFGCKKRTSSTSRQDNPPATSEATRRFEGKLAEVALRGLLRRCAPVVQLGREDLQRLVALAQVEAKFIVARLGSELLVLVDQHAAAERVELERLQRRVLGAGHPGPEVEAAPVQAGRGVIVPVTMEELRWFEKHRAHAERWGFRFSPAPSAASAAGSAPVGPAVLVTHAPEVLGSALAPADLKAVIAEAEAAGCAVTAPSVVLHILAFKACRRAIKFGDPLTRTDMARLLRDLSACEFPFQCAHGRPTVYPFLSLGALRQMRSTLSEKKVNTTAIALAKFLNAQQAVGEMPRP